MMPEIIFQKREGKFASLEEQRNVANSLIFELTGRRVKHSNSGRPIIGDDVDISISHKNDSVCIGIVSAPYRIGVDVEHLKSDINAELFLKSVITEDEMPFFEIFCKKNKLAESSGVVIFWSVKEAFFKCLDYDLKPGKIRISNIDKKGEIAMSFSPEIKSVMSEKGISFCFADVLLEGRHIYSKIVMRSYISDKLSTV